MDGSVFFSEDHGDSWDMLAPAIDLNISQEMAPADAFVQSSCVFPPRAQLPVLIWLWFGVQGDQPSFYLGD